jgi:hypothetical protein
VVTCSGRFRALLPKTAAGAARCGARPLYLLAGDYADLDSLTQTKNYDGKPLIVRSAARRPIA